MQNLQFMGQPGRVLLRDGDAGIQHGQIFGGVDARGGAVMQGPRAAFSDAHGARQGMQPALAAVVADKDARGFPARGCHIRGTP